LTPIYTLVRSVPVTGFTQPLQKMTYHFVYATQQPISRVRTSDTLHGRS